MFAGRTRLEEVEEKGGDVKQRRWRWRRRFIGMDNVVSKCLGSMLRAPCALPTCNEGINSPPKAVPETTDNDNDDDDNNNDDDEWLLPVSFVSHWLTTYAAHRSSLLSGQQPEAILVTKQELFSSR